jgi:hypothetical protein
MPFAELAELVGLRVDAVSKRFSRALLKTVDSPILTT